MLRCVLSCSSLIVTARWKGFQGIRERYLSFTSEDLTGHLYVILLEKVNSMTNVKFQDLVQSHFSSC